MENSPARLPVPAYNPFFFRKKETMFKRLLTLLALSASITTGLAQAQTKWDMPTPYPDSEFQTKNNIQFAEDVRKATNGALDIKVHTANSLIKNPEIKRAVQTGQVQIGEIFKPNLGPEDPVFELDAIPFFAASYREARALLEVSRPAINEKLMKQGLRPLYMVPWPSQAFFTKKPINSIADLKGLKMRTYNAQTARLAQLMGTVPTTVQATEIPQAFTSGMIDTMFTSAPTAVSSKAWDYTKNVYDTQAWVPKNVVFVNEKAFQALPEAVRKVVLEQAAIAETRGWTWSQRDNDETPKELVKNGMNLSPIGPAFKAELKKIGDQMLDDWLKKAGPEGQKIVDAYNAKLK
jgi:TRAP-type C4-dicarboxylate transport system substrate-binding protein